MIDTKITFNWMSPLNTGGLGVKIDKYRIQVQNYDLFTFSDAPSLFCNGSLIDIVEAMSC